MRAVLLLALLSCSATPTTPPSNHGVVKNDANPWLIQMDDGRRFGCLANQEAVVFRENADVSLFLQGSSGLIISVVDQTVARGHCVDLTR